MSRRLFFMKSAESTKEAGVGPPERVLLHAWSSVGITVVMYGGVGVMGTWFKLVSVHNPMKNNAI